MLTNLAHGRGRFAARHGPAQQLPASPIIHATHHNEQHLYGYVISWVGEVSTSTAQPQISVTLL